jgi:hypothetical protein
VYDVGADCTGTKATQAGWFRVVHSEGGVSYLAGVVDSGGPSFAYSTTPHKADHPEIRFHSSPNCEQFGWLADGMYGEAGRWVHSLGLVCDRAPFSKHLVKAPHVLPPAAPVAVLVSGRSPTQVDVSWMVAGDNPLKPVDRYEVDRRESLRQISAPGATGTYWNVVASNLDAGRRFFVDNPQVTSKYGSPTQPYTYRVCALNRAGWGCSDPVEVKRSGLAPRPTSGQVRITCPSVSLRLGLPILIKGTTFPARPGVSVVVTIDNGKGSKFKQTVTTLADGSFSATFNTSIPGEFAADADWVGDPNNAQAFCGFNIAEPSSP